MTIFIKVFLASRDRPVAMLKPDKGDRERATKGERRRNERKSD